MSENGVQNGTSNPDPKETSEQNHEQNEKIPAPSFGFTKEGTFIIEVDVRHGLMIILAFLTRGISFINGAINQQEAKMREEIKQKSLLKPKNINGSGKFFGLFK